MGFFKSFGLDFGRRPGEAFGSESYIPLTYFDTAALQRDAACAGHDIGDEVEVHSRRLSETIAGTNSGDVYETLSYSVREVMRNVLEHAQVESFGIGAQYWPTKSRAEVAMVDRGIGLQASLSRNPISMPVLTRVQSTMRSCLLSLERHSRAHQDRRTGARGRTPVSAFT